MSLSDRFIAFFSPSWAARRKLDRIALEQVEKFGLTEANPTRLDRAPTNRGSSADYENELGSDRRELVERARLADERNLLARAILDRSVESVVGTGFRLQAMTDDPKWNQEAEDLWNEWCENEADSRGLLTFNEIMATMYRSQLRDGDVGCILLDDGTLRLVESDEIADTLGATRPDNVDGIELDARGRPVAFNVYKPDRRTYWPDRRVAPTMRIPADQFVFLASRKRAGQTRGLTRFKGMFWHLDQIDGTLEAITVATRMAACLGLIIKRPGSGTGLPGNLPTTTDGAGATKRKLRLEPGGVSFIQPGEDVFQVTPTHATTSAREHIRELERLASSGFPITLEMVLGDYTASNYANSRNARMEARERAKIEQAPLKKAHTRFYWWKLVQFMESKMLRSRPDALKHRWIPPGWNLVDPVTELQAAQAAIDSGLSTRTIEAARLGYDFKEDILPQLKEEAEALKKAGLEPVRSTLTRDPAPPPGQDAGAPGKARSPAP